MHASDLKQNPPRDDAPQDIGGGIRLARRPSMVAPLPLGLPVGSVGTRRNSVGTARKNDGAWSTRLPPPMNPSKPTGPPPTSSRGGATDGSWTTRLPPPPPIPAIPNVPKLSWVVMGQASCQEGVLTMMSGGLTSWFVDPLSEHVVSNAPALTFGTGGGDCELSALVDGTFNAPFDAAALCVYQGPLDYATLCYERTADDKRTIRSVVTRGTSDEAEVPVHEAAKGKNSGIYLRVMKEGPQISFHQSVDGDYWMLERRFRLRDPGLPTFLGFLVQSPEGSGCTATFSEVGFLLPG